MFYLIGSCVGPSPYPEMVKYFQKIIGEEAKKQILEQENKLPKAIVACIGGGSNSIGLFTDFIKEKDVDILTDLNKLFKKSVPLTVRKYVIAYMLKESLKHYHSFGNNRRDRNDKNRNNKYERNNKQKFERANKALVELQKQFADETIIVVTHGQFARNLIAAHFECNYHEVATFVNAEIRMLNI